MGLTANVDYAVRHDLWLGLRGEGVSSFARDAPLEGRIAPSGFRGLLTLTWSRDLVNRDLRTTNVRLPTIEAAPAPNAVSPSDEPALAPTEPPGPTEPPAPTEPTAPPPM